MSKEPKRNVYVGHRYVPKIMGEWDKQQSYEGLSIVTHQGTSYTSKKHVPVGIDILDEEYWVVTGNYNAQIEEYRKDVRDMQDQVNNELNNMSVDVDRRLNNLNNHVENETKNLEKSISSLKTETNRELEKLNSSLARQDVKFTKELDEKAEKWFVNRELSNVKQQISDIITTPAEDISKEEIIDARENKKSLGENIRDIRNKTKTDIYSIIKGDLRSTETWRERDSIIKITDKGFLNIKGDGESNIPRIQQVTNVSYVKGRRIYFRFDVDNIPYDLSYVRVGIIDTSRESLDFTTRFSDLTVGKLNTVSGVIEVEEDGVGSLDFQIGGVYPSSQIAEENSFDVGNLITLDISDFDVTKEDMDFIVEDLNMKSFINDIGGGELSSLLFKKIYKDEKNSNLIINKIKNGGFENTNNWRARDAEIHAENGYMFVKGDGYRNDYPRIQQATNIPYEQDKLIYFRFNVDYIPKMNFRHVRVGVIDRDRVARDFTTIFKNLKTDQSNTISGTIKLEQGSGDLDFQIAFIYDSLNDISDNYIRVSDVILLDITEIFGKGNEPNANQVDFLFREMEWFDYKPNDKEYKRSVLKNIFTKTSGGSNNGLNTILKPELSINDSIDRFVLEMNKKAEQMKMYNTNFMNPHGRNVEGHYSTTNDLIKLGLIASGYNKIAWVWNKDSYSFDVYDSDKLSITRSITVNSTYMNSPLMEDYHIFGGKTGSPGGEPRLKNLLSIVEAPDGNMFIGCIMGTGDRFEASKELFDIATNIYNGEDPSDFELSAEMGSVALMPKYNPILYKNYDIDMLFEKNGDLKDRMASITKLMTAMVFLDHYPISEFERYVEIQAEELEGGWGEPMFNKGETIKVKDVFNTLLIPSDNTCANVLARIAGERILTSEY